MLEVYYIPQVPMKAFTVKVKTVEEAKLVLKTLYNFSNFEFENKIKYDYSDAGWLEIDWEEWYDEEWNDINDLIW